MLLYTDDTSGNLTKKWNKFDVWCFLLGALPRSENAKLENIHFISCSNSVSGENDSYCVYMHVYHVMSVYFCAVNDILSAFLTMLVLSEMCYWWHQCCS